MSLESVFKLSLIMNMIDNLSGPMAGVASKVGANVSKLDAASQTFGSMAKAGAAMQETGSQIVNAVLAPVEATFETRRALGELASLGVQDLEAVENAARSFSDQWAGTSKADFISAAYDIKSGIASLSDEGVAEFTSLAALTAKATKSTAGEMTSLFATGYGIYKDYYSDLSDMEFGEMFSAGISDAVRAFKTSGSGMAQAIQNLGASATTAQVPLEEQLSVLGMLQATMGGAEAGTKYKAFLRSATKGGEELGLKFTDANNQLLSMPEILDILRGKFGETMDAAEKMELQKAFGDTEAVALIDLMYNKVGDLQDNIVNMYSKKRKKAQKTQGFVTVSRTDMTGEAVKIPKGHVFKSILDINGEELRFFVLEAATLQKGASSVDVLVEAETEGSRYNVPAGQIVRTLTYLGDVTFSNAEDWIVREGSDTEDDESARARTLRSWSELAQRATEDTFIDAAESVPGVLFAQADCNHPRGQGTVDVIVTGTAGEATEGLLAAVREAVDKIAGPYDNILVKSSVTVSQNISVTVTTDTADTDEAVENRVKAILTELLAVRRSRKLNELTLSDINHAIRSGYSGATNAAVSEPEADVKLGKDKVITLGDVSVTVERE